jgi:sulfur carrier protein
MEVLTINGVQKQFPKGKLPGTIAKLLEHLDINEATVVAEINGRIIQKQNFADTSLTDGQSIELVRFVGGG